MSKSERGSQQWLSRGLVAAIGGHFGILKSPLIFWAVCFRKLVGWETWTSLTSMDILWGMLGITPVDDRIGSRRDRSAI